MFGGFEWPFGIRHLGRVATLFGHEAMFTALNLLPVPSVGFWKMDEKAGRVWEADFNLLNS